MNNFIKYEIENYNFHVADYLSFVYDKSKERIIVFDERDDCLFIIISFKNNYKTLTIQSRSSFCQEITNNNIYIYRK